ncbi:hypothetical protein D0Z03_002661 [Geotrichum reessii]|nr:hypothetical protein D0Z03_002661 [Galactomyces reessii]
MLRYLKSFQLQGTNLEIFRFAFYVSFPIGTMIWVGIDTHEKFNVPKYQPDPARLNQIPKDPVEIRAEVERMRAERIERRKRLEEKARRLNMLPLDEENKDEGLSNVAGLVAAPSL